MKKIMFLFGLCVCMPAVAEEVAAENTKTETVVVERMSCSDMQARIKELSDVEDDTGDVAAEIASLTQDYRRSCMRSAAGRRASTTTRAPVIVAESEQVEEVEPEQATEETPVEAETVAEEVSVAEEVVSEITPEQELANLDAGLCADGSKPNQFGCCGDEIFKDLGNTVFACCPKSGGDDSDCFPPIN